MLSALLELCVTNLNIWYFRIFIRFNVFFRNFSLNFFFWVNGFFSKSYVVSKYLVLFLLFFCYQLWFSFHRTQRIHSIWYQFFIFLRLFNGPGCDPPWYMFNQDLKKVYILVLLGGDSSKYQFDPVSWWWWWWW